MDILLEPFGYPFFVKGLLVATIAGALCGLIGVYVVLRGMSYIGHGLSHAIFGWAVPVALLNLNFFVGASIGGFVSALMVNRVARRRTIGADASIGVVTTVIFALGIALISVQRRFVRNFEATLFGNVLAVTPEQIAVVAGVAVAVAMLVVLLYRPLLFTTFDPEVAEASGVRTRRMDSLLSLGLAATIVATMQVIGVLLVAAALVIPAVIARLLTDSFGRMVLLATAIGAAGGVVGIYASYYANVASGPAIVLTEGAAFLVAYAATARRRPRLAASTPHL